MSNLRIIGLVVGVIGLILTFIVHRGTKWNKSNFILLSLFNLSLVTICINPNVLNALRDALALQEAYRGRILALLIASNIIKLCFFWF